MGKVQLINAVDFCKQSTKSLGNKRYDIMEDDVQQILKLYLDFEEGEYSKIFRNQDFGQYELTIEQPLRDADGNIVLKRGKKQPDTSKRDTEKIALDTDWKRYFNEEVLPHIDPDSWVELGKTRKLYEINFTKYFFKFTEQEPSAVIAERIKERETKLESMMKTLFDD